MKRIDTALPGVFLIEPVLLPDERGYFFESYRRDLYAQMGITDEFVQDNYVRSVRGVVRGLHFQHPRPQAKLCFVASGEVLDVVVDVRRGSPHFGKHIATVLSEENRLQIYVPAGFAHGYSALSDKVEFVYKCSDFYCPQFERGVLWDDPQMGIDWQVPHPRLSDKDRRHLRLSEISPEELPSYLTQP
jgi:dTDP-4-dehydrorhamnose 3,5-epimerase